MSINSEPTEIHGLGAVKKYDPLINLSSNQLYFINKSGLETAYNQINSPGSNIASASFTISPLNGRHCVMDRYVLLKVPLTFTITGTSTTGNLIDPEAGIFAPRNYPLNNNILSATFNIGGSGGSFTSQPYRLVSAFQHHHSYQEEANVYLSTFPSLPDRCQYYNQLGPTSLNNPLAPYKGSNFWQQTRGSYPYTIVSNSPTSATIEIVVVEPIICPPFLLSPNEKEYGLYGIISANLTLNFVPNFYRFWSFNADADSGKTITDISVQMGTSTLANPQLLVKFVTPPLEMEIPKQIFYPSLSFEIVDGTAQTINARQTATLSVNGIQLGSIPTHIYIFARRSSSDITGPDGFKYADGYASIQTAAINYGMKNVLNGATTEDLWRISVKNGMKLTYGDWVGNGQGDSSIGVGSVLCIKPTEDFGAEFAEAAGVPNPFNIGNINITVKNLSDSAVNMVLTVILITNKVIIVDKFSGPISSVETFLTNEDVLNAPVYNSPEFEEAIDSIGGRNPMRSLKKIGKDFLKGLKKGVKTVVDVASDPLTKKIVKTGVDYAKLLAKGNGMMPNSLINKKLAMAKKNMLPP